MKLLILDFDGTLGDTAKCIVQTTQKTLGELGYKMRTDEEIRQFIGLPLSAMFENFLQTENSDVIEKCTDTYRKFFFEIQEETVSLFPGVSETLRKLHQAGWTLAIASSRGHESLDELCKRFGLDKYISKIVGNEDVEHKKPAPEMVQEILSAFQMRAEDAVVVVGDTIFDIQMGQKAGCTTCGVSYGNHSRAQLEEQDATFVIDRFEELLEVLNLCG